MRSIDLVREFHRVFGQPIAEQPNISDMRLNKLRLSLILEEFLELRNALYKGDVVEALDALTDLQYVLDGSYLSLGFASVKEAAFKAVHTSNMTKEGGERRADGKILKGPSYRPPDLLAIMPVNGLGHCVAGAHPEPLTHASKARAAGTFSDEEPTNECCFDVSDVEVTNG